MKLLITGICGFAGSRLAFALQERFEGCEIAGLDNLMRAGSEENRSKLRARGIRFIHADLRLRSDVESMPECDWVVDAAANPSVLAGVDGKSSPRQVIEHNLLGTLNLLEYCRAHKAGLVLLSTNRVYSIRDLTALPLEQRDAAFALSPNLTWPVGVSAAGISESFAVRQPISLYGATKLASETMALEYSLSFGFPVWINRCGILAGAGQFGTAEQGIFSFWLHAHAARAPLRYIGFGGHGYQVRDALHPDDLADLISLQLRREPRQDPIYHVGGGFANAISLAQLTAWCDTRFGPYAPESDPRSRPFDIPWLIMDCARAEREFAWTPKRSLHFILDEIAAHVETHPDWLVRCGAV